MPQFSDGVIAYLSEDRRALTVHQLPSKLRRLAVHRWTLEFDFVVARFSLDAAQDLLVLVPFSATPGPSQWFEPRILLRALSTGQPHPFASPSAASAGAIELAESKLQATMDGDTTSIHDSFLGTVVHGGATDELRYYRGEGQSEKHNKTKKKKKKKKLILITGLKPSSFVSYLFLMDANGGGRCGG
ncbi:hypothetical protein EDB86DRAFT_1462873 [Lactarius hatsudake]|nr:hypothetical protein EDB86DRAFT_1462873 [Lactarius hatsudake]